MHRMLGGFTAALLTLLLLPASTSAEAGLPMPSQQSGIRAHQLFDDTTGPSNPALRRGSPVTHLVHARVDIGDRTPVAPGQTPTSSTTVKVEAAGAGGAAEILGFAQYGEVTSGAWTSDFHFQDLTTIAYFGINLNSNGTIVNDAGFSGWWSSETTSLMNTAHSYGDRVVLTVKDFSSSSIETLVGNETNRQSAINQILNQLITRGGDGVNVDFEGYTPTVSPSDFDTFIAELEYALRSRDPNSSYLTVDTYASAAMGGTMFDIPGLHPYVDAFDVMDYDISYPGSSNAGPVAPLNGNTYSDTNVVGSYLNEVPASQLILGVPYYGYKWCVTQPTEGAPVNNSCANGVASADTYSGVFDDLSCALQLGQHYDSTYQEPWATWWSPASGDPCGGNHNSWRELFWENAQSLGAKYDLVNAHALRGIGIWALGYDSGHNELWNEIQAKFPVVHQAGGAPVTGTTLTLGRYFGPEGHWVTTAQPTPTFVGGGPGYEEAPLGTLSEVAGSGLQALYSCVAGTTHFLSHDQGCEGQQSLGLDGYAATAVQGNYTLPLYRCLLVGTGDHFVSWDPKCEGQYTEGLLGYAQNEVQLLRFFGSDHWSEAGQVTSAFHLEGTLGFLPLPAPGGSRLYNCLAGYDHFSTTASNCEGQEYIGVTGGIYPTPPAGVSSAALYRCFIGGDHFDTTSSTCEGTGTPEGRLGYILTS